MKKWLRKLLNNILYSGPEECRAVQVSADKHKHTPDVDPILNFRVFAAVGGKVVEFNKYDPKTDRRDSTTYIITNDQDFGERISKIATMESLKI